MKFLLMCDCHITSDIMTIQDDNQVNAGSIKDKASGKGGVHLWYAISFAAQLGFLIVVPISAFMWLGHWGDLKLQTSPILLIAGIVTGLFATVYEVYHLILPFTKGHHG